MKKSVCAPVQTHALIQRIMNLINMLWRTHIRIANEILYRLGIPKDSIQARYLREGSVIPDKWGDYPHHHEKAGTIQRYILRARGLFLADDLANAYFCLGVALHYVQDSYTSLASRSKHHNSWEQQIEESYFVDNLEECIVKAFHSRPDRMEEYTARARFLSDKLEGKKETLWLATMPGPGLTFWGDCIYGKPYVDLNFALKASLLIAKSVLGSRECPYLQADMKRVYQEHEQLMRETESSFVDKVVELITKRDELHRKRTKDGVLHALRNCFLTFAIKIRNLQAQSIFDDYKQKKHLKKVLKRYDEKVEMIIKPHRDWYNFAIPQIDINIVEEELITVQQASEFFQMEKTFIQSLIKKNNISCCHVKDQELIKKSDLRRTLKT